MEHHDPCCFVEVVFLICATSESQFPHLDIGGEDNIYSLALFMVSGQREDVGEVAQRESGASETPTECDLFFSLPCSLCHGKQ